MNCKLLFWFGTCDVTSMNNATSELAVNEPLGDVADSMVALFNEATRISKEHGISPGILHIPPMFPIM